MSGIWNKDTNSQSCSAILLEFITKDQVLDVFYFPDYRKEEYDQCLQPKISQGLLFHGNSAPKVFMKLICHSTKWMSDPFYSCICLLACIPTTNNLCRKG